MPAFLVAGPTAFSAYPNAENNEFGVISCSAS
ncbi:hypothetical protein DFR37_101321 [Eoetvoesiella caeni]|uniref:Uncharacterized protein n=1 Tax=Eoetvoesiella caeni TaxID=645616 RepID=A0A366HJU7_9BURK|nr:hypothetical protein DFR37_101321 [Eoetvoesiella caeni]